MPKGYTVRLARSASLVRPALPALRLARYLSHSHHPESIHPAGDESAHITEVSAVKGASGGLHVVDKFVVRSVELVDRIVAEFNLVGEGAIVYHSKNHLTAMLAPPLRFSFKTKRVGEKHPTELCDLFV